MKIFKRIKPSKIEEILNKDEELIHKLENTTFPKNASWRKRGSWNNIDSKAYHGSLYITNRRLILVLFLLDHYERKIDRELCTINLEEIIQVKYSMVDQWLWKKNHLRKSDINPKYKYEITRILGGKISYKRCPFGPELLIEKRNGTSEKFILPKATPAIIEKLDNHRNKFVDKLTTDAKDREIALDYDAAIQIWEKLGEIKEATRIRKLKAEQFKVDQTVVHGDYVDDRDTIIKDSVLNRTNVGASSDDKFAKLDRLADMKEKGLIDDAEFKQMKKEILEK